MKYGIMVVTLGVIFSACEVLGQDTLRFGRVRRGDIARDTLHIKNVNPVALMISNPRVSHPAFQLPPAPFTGMPPAPFTGMPSMPLTGSSTEIEPDKAVPLPVSFAPDRLGDFTADLTMDTNLGTLGYVLSGEGVEEVVVINEILADPPSGDAGDANGDGMQERYEDEFIEILNTGLKPILIGGWELLDNSNTSKRFTFPEETWIDPGEYIVLFGGGTPTGFEGKVFVDDGKIGSRGLSNTNDEVFLINSASEDTLARAEWGREGGKDQSLVRYPEGIGEWVLHSDFPGKGTRFSPGRARIVLSDLAISPPDTTINFGAELTLYVDGIYTDGSESRIEDDDLLEWTVSDPSKLSSIEKNTWQATAPGRVRVRVRMGDIVAEEIEVVILPPQITTIEIAFSDTTVLVRETLPLRVIGRLADQSHTELHDGITWEVSQADVADFEENAVTFSAPGTYQLTANYNALSASVTVHVQRRGDLNGDGQIDLLDAVRLVHLILDIPPEGSALETRSADIDQNDTLDIRDLIGLIVQFTGADGSAGKKAVASLEGWWWEEGGELWMQTNVPVHVVVGKMSGESANFEPRDGLIAAASVNNNELNFVLGSMERNGFGDAPNPLGKAHGEVQYLDVYTLSGATARLLSKPKTSEILSSFPNPFNPDTVIEYAVAVETRISLSIFTPTGQEVIRLSDQVVSPGRYRAVWNGRDAQGRPVGSGVYIARLKGANFHAIRKLVLLK